MTEILLFEYYLLAAQVWAQGLAEEARSRALGAASMNQTDTWHDEVFKLEIVQKTIEATKYDQLKKRLFSPRVLWPRDVRPSENADIGAVVQLSEEGYPEEEYLLTGDTAIPQYGLITIRSPLGESVLGTTRGSSIRVQMPAGSTQFKVVGISYDISKMLMHYLVSLYKNTERYLNDSSRGRVSVEGNHFEVMASIGIHTATLEALLLIFRAYGLSSPLEQQSREALAKLERVIEGYGVPSRRFGDAAYCHPKQV